MALSANRKLQRKAQPAIKKLKCVNGELHIYEGALLNYEASNIGYVMPGTDTLSQEFAGIALEEVNVAAADNTADGTFSVEVLPRGCGEEVLLDMSVGITIANEGDAVYLENDGQVGISGVTNTTGGFVGIIRQFVSNTQAWVQLTQHPTM